MCVPLGLWMSQHLSSLHISPSIQRICRVFHIWWNQYFGSNCNFIQSSFFTLGWDWSTPKHNIRKYHHIRIETPGQNLHSFKLAYEIMLHTINPIWQHHRTECKAFNDFTKPVPPQILVNSWQNTTFLAVLNYSVFFQNYCTLLRFLKMSHN